MYLNGVLINMYMQVYAIHIKHVTRVFLYIFLSLHLTQKNNAIMLPRTLESEHA